MGELATAQRDPPRYKCVDKGGNKLGEKGVAYLSKAQWGRVNEVELSNDVVT